MPGRPDPQPSPPFQRQLRSAMVRPRPGRKQLSLAPQSTPMRLRPQVCASQDAHAHRLSPSARAGQPTALPVRKCLQVAYQSPCNAHARWAPSRGHSAPLSISPPNLLMHQPSSVACWSLMPVRSQGHYRWEPLQSRLRCTSWALLCRAASQRIPRARPGHSLGHSTIPEPPALQVCAVMHPHPRPLMLRVKGAMAGPELCMAPRLPMSRRRRDPHTQQDRRVS